MVKLLDMSELIMNSRVEVFFSLLLSFSFWCFFKGRFRAGHSSTHFDAPFLSVHIASKFLIPTFTFTDSLLQLEEFSEDNLYTLVWNSFNF